MEKNLTPSAEQVKSVRFEREVSIFEAKSIVQRDLLLDAVNSAESLDDLKQVVACLIKNVRIN